MALVIDETNSMFGGSGFSLQHAAVAGNVFVTVDGTVWTPGVNAFFLRGRFPWTVQIDGLVNGGNGIVLQDEGSLAKITVGKSGEIFATSFGIYAWTPTDIVNYGLIKSGGAALRNFNEGSFTVTNYGEILSGLSDGLASISLENVIENDLIGIRTIDNKV